MKVSVVALLGTALLVVVATTTAATAAPGVKDPKPLILRQADMPRGATYEAGYGASDYLVKPLKAAGLSGRAAEFLGATFSQEKGSLQVSGVVITTSNPSQARKVFPLLQKAREAFLRGLGGTRRTPVSLPSFGNQQVALIDPPGNEGIALADVFVRKNSTVWLLHVKLERRPAPPVAELVAELGRYAAKQKTRVGAG